MSMLKRIVRRSKEDNGNAVIILGLMLIMALLLVGGLLLDVSKAYQMKSSYIDAAKKATQTAIMEQSSDGFLRPESAGLLISTYENVTRPSVVNRDGYFSKCENYQDKDVSLEVWFTDEAGNSKRAGNPILRSNINHNDSTRQIIDKMGIIGATKNKIINQKNTGITLKVTEGTENVILPGAFSITQSDTESATNMKCQKMEIAAKANIFLGDSEGKYD